MKTMTDIHYRPATWADDRESLEAIRMQVFVKEQGVPVELEIDEEDPEAFHILARTNTHENIATGRLLSNGHIGRMCVLKTWRHKGVGSQVLEHLLAQARVSGMEQVFLNAQTCAQDFYLRKGFVAQGPEFMDAGIPHVRMELDLKNE